MNIDSFQTNVFPHQLTLETWLSIMAYTIKHAVVKLGRQVREIAYLWAEISERQPLFVGCDK